MASSYVVWVDQGVIPIPSKMEQDSMRVVLLRTAHSVKPVLASSLRDKNTWTMTQGGLSYLGSCNQSVQSMVNWLPLL